MTVPNDSERPTIDYLCRDYASLRQLLLDQFSVELPAWTERHAADLGIALIELLAWAGDYHSYYQDAVAAEAYLTTARQRISLRRHARLVDYALNEGVNARVFVHLATTEDGVVVPAGTALLTDRVSSEAAVGVDALQSPGGVIFETMHEVELFRAHNRMQLDAGNGPILPAGSTTAALQGEFPRLHRGDLLLMQPLPAIGEPLPDSGHIVRLVVEPELIPSPRGPLTSIRWFDEDALPEAMMIAPNPAEGPGANPRCRVLGNLVLADHGFTIVEDLAPVSQAGNYNPRLRSAGVTHAAPYSHREAMEASAAAALVQRVEQVEAAIVLTELHPAFNADGAKSEALGGKRWHARRDLLAGNRFARDFVAEVGNSGHCILRFGDGEYGRRPAVGSVFRARYRIGQGVAGNVGAHAVRHIVWGDRRIVSVSNPLAAGGGTNPETAVQVRVNAPQAFRVQRRCVTAPDYEEAARGFPGVASAFAERTPGSPPSTDRVTIHIARAGSIDPSADFLERVRLYLLPLALIGDTVQVVAATPEPIAIEMSVAVLPGFSSQEVARKVTDRVRTAVAAAQIRLGQTVYASHWVAVAAAVPGVASVTVNLQPTAQPQPVRGTPSGPPMLVSSVTVPKNSIPRLEPRVTTIAEGA